MPADRRLITTAVVAGLALGFLDFVWIKFVPFPLGDLGNSSAVWAVAAFLFALLSRSTPARAALGAAVLLAEAALQARRIGDPNYGDDPAWLAAIRVVLAVLLIALTVRPTRQRLVVLAACVPLAVAGFTGFALACFA